MSTALKTREPAESAFLNDRPGWIPPGITSNWDTNPYAYQTEEELMPAGGLHGEILAYTVEILRSHLEKKNLKLLIDTFMMYRDVRGIKQRVAPDLLLMPHRAAPSSYDFDTEPPPLGTVEVTSPKSHLKDKQDNLSLYTDLGIPTYLVIDAVTPKAKLREQIGLYLWRREAGKIRRMHPDSEGFLLFPEMDVRVKAIGQSLIFSDNATGEILHDTGQLGMLLENERQRAEQETKRAEKETKRAEKERKRAEKERKRAEQETKRAEAAEQRTLETARNMLADGLSPGLVMKYTGLSEKEINPKGFENP